MKELLDFEKEIVSQIVSIDLLETKNPTIYVLTQKLLRYPINFHIDDNVYNVTIGIDKNYQESLISKYGTDAISRMNYDINSFLTIVIRLIQYLSIENQIEFKDNELNKELIGEKFTEELILTLKNRETENVLYYILKKNIIPQTPLKRYVENGFISEEKIEELKIQRNINRKLNWTAIGVIVSLILGLTGNFIEIYKASKQEKIEYKIVIEANKDAFKQIQKNIKDSTTIDTIKVIKK